MFNSAALAETWEGSIRWSLKHVQFQTSWLLQHWGDLGICLVGLRFWKSSKLRGTGIRSQWIYNRDLWWGSNGVIELLENRAGHNCGRKMTLKWAVKRKVIFHADLTWVWYSLFWGFNVERTYLKIRATVFFFSQMSSVLIEQ